MVPETGIEPVRGLKPRRILSPVRLPISPLRLMPFMGDYLIIMDRSAVVNSKTMVFPGGFADGFRSSEVSEPHSAEVNYMLLNLRNFFSDNDVISFIC
jgi:hypothetical protein